MSEKREQSYKVAIIGPEAVASGFKMLGVRFFPATDSDELVRTFLDLQKKTMDAESGEKYACVIVMEDLLEHVSDEDYSRMTREPLPALVALPGTKGSTGASGERLRVLTQRAIGTDIM